MDDFILLSKDRNSLRDLLPLQKPLSLYIEPTNLCNFRCAPCVHGSENTRNDLKPLCNIDMSLFKKIVSELKNWSGPKLKLIRLAVLGEPFVDSDFCKMLSLLKEADVADRIDTFSNGSLLTKELANELVIKGLDSIRFSIYSVVNERHEKVTRSKVSIEDIHQNIKTLREVRDNLGSKTPKIIVKMFDSFSSEENKKFYELYSNIADEIGLERIHNASKYSGNDLVKMYYDNPTHEKIVNDDYEASLNKARIACPRAFMSMVINNIGDCLACAHDPAKGTKVGNIKENTLKEIWKGERMFEFRKMMLEGRKSENRICANCDWFQLFPEEDNVDGFDIERLR